MQVVPLARGAWQAAGPGDAAVAALVEEAARGLQPIGHLRWEARGGALHATADARVVLGRAPDDALTLAGLLGLVRRSRVNELRARWGEAVAQRQRRIEMDVPCVLVRGQTHHIRVVALNDYDADGTLQRCVAAVQDVTQQLHLSGALFDAETRLAEAQQMASLGAWEWDFRRKRVIYSAEALRILNPPAEAVAQWDQLPYLVPEDQRAAVDEIFAQAMRQRLPSLSYDYHLIGADGLRRELHGRARLFYDEQGQAIRLIGTVQDVTELRDVRRQVHTLAFSDPVTALPNRNALLARMNALLRRPNAGEFEWAVITLGLDRFTKVNESMGHAAGDELLRLLGGRLTKTLRETDVVARAAGDAFTILLPKVRHADGVARVASKLIHALSAPFAIDGQDVFISASMGAAMHPSDGVSAETLLQHSEAAFSHAKASGRNRVHFYAPQLTAQAAQRLALESELRHGIERHELLLHFQPKFELGTQRLVGAEALMRWNQPQRGMVPPVSFIPLAEETGLIVRLGAWALHEACAAVSAWNRGRARDPLKVAVNLSVRQFGEGLELVDVVRGALAATGCKPQWLELEITESLLIDGSESVRQCLLTLAHMGITLAIDDFGTGYSALGYLSRLPVQTLKIDRSFVSELPGNTRSAELVKAIVSVGRSMNLTLVAEGVETREQADHLTALGCHLAQGYLFGRPVERAAFDELLIGQS